jgi:putative IMPACT (imprinted ancient) family translation regulator
MPVNLSHGCCLAVALRIQAAVAWSLRAQVCCRLMQTVDKECEETNKLMCEVRWQHESDATIAEVMEHANRVLAFVDAELESDKVCGRVLVVVCDIVCIL